MSSEAELPARPAGGLWRYEPRIALREYANDDVNHGVRKFRSHRLASIGE
jgi:hypothetical protein